MVVFFFLFDLLQNKVLKLNITPLLISSFPSKEGVLFFEDLGDEKVELYNQ